MSLLAQFIRTYSTFLLVSYLTSFTTEVHAPAAPDFFGMNKATTRRPLVQSTSTDDFEEKGKEKEDKSTDASVYCSTPPNIPHAELDETSLDQNLFFMGSVVTYKCSTNYINIPGAANKAMCLRNGAWSLPDTFCKQQEHFSNTDQTTKEDDFEEKDDKSTDALVFCSAPPNIPHAELDETSLDQNLFYMGSVVTYKCTTNYVNIPGAANKAMCLRNGTWSLLDTFCKPNFCSSPPRMDLAQPTDSSLSQSTFPKGSTVTFTCRPGYTRNPGSRNIAKCLNDGTWSLPTIDCQRRKCGNPGEVENADMEAKDFLFGSKVTYTCNAGYRMIGRRNYRECRADGSWSNALPVCEVQLCPSPPEILSGEMYPFKEEYTYLDSVTYSCKGNLALIGEKSISCKEDGQWSSEAPKCKDVKCQTPYVTYARRLSGTSGPYSLNSVVVFMCNAGYVMRGSDNIKCNEYSQWEPEPPKCLGVCKYLPLISFAELVEPPIENEFVEGTSLKFKCKEGFNPVPGENNVLTCQGTRWSQYTKFCTPISCGNPGPIKNGYIAAGSHEYGSGVTYACHTGYKIKEGSYRNCQKDGNWSLPVPECEVQTCRPPNSTLAISIIPQKLQYQYNDKVTFSCNEGYQLSGKSESSCNDEGRWIPDPPSCKGICHAPPELEYATLNVYHDEATFFIGDKVRYTCKHGYLRNHHQNIVACFGSLTWSHPVQFCSRISCGAPEVIPNGVYEAKDFLFDSEAVYTCSKGYKMNSEINSRKCLATGKWSVPAPKCEVQTCPTPDHLENGSYSKKKEIYEYLDSVTYKCDNLTLVGEASVSCTEEGNWTSGAPVCKAVCKSPPKLEYGCLEKASAQNLYFNVGTALKYECRPGYVSAENKSNEIICHEDLKWSEPEVFCKRTSCGQPGEIPYGKIHAKDFLFESRANYTCNSGYTMISRHDFRYCQADGTWNGTSPVCKASICDNIWELQEEVRKCTSTPDEWIKYLQVQYFYLQIENLKLDIEIKKKKLSDESTTREQKTDY